MNASRAHDQRQLEATVERLVREALRACQTARPQVTSRATVIHDRVVSLELLSRVASDAREIQVPAGAVITPAAADHIRQSQIRLTRTPSRDGATGRANGRVLSAAAKDAPASVASVPVAPPFECWITDVDHPQRSEGLARQLVLRGLAVDPLAEIPLVAEPGKRWGVVVSELPGLVVDRLAREHSICAAAVDSVELVRRLAEKMTPVVWVVDSHRLSLTAVVAVGLEALRSSLQGASLQPQESR